MKYLIRRALRHRDNGTQMNADFLDFIFVLTTQPLNNLTTQLIRRIPQIQKTRPCPAIYSIFHLALTAANPS